MFFINHIEQRATYNYIYNFNLPSINYKVGTATYCLHQVTFPGLIYKSSSPRIRRQQCLELKIVAEKTNKRNITARCMASLEPAERWLGYTKSRPYAVP